MSSLRSTSVLALALLLGAGTSAATAPLLEVVAAAPTLAAARQRIEAAKIRSDSAGRLPNPEVEGMGSRMRADMPDESATMWELNFRQPLPKLGERAADRARARAGVSMAEAEFAAMAGELAAETAMALAEIEGVEARIRVLETQLGRLDALLQGIDAQVATGAGRVADRLTVQSRFATMQLMLEQERRMAADLAAEARGRLGLAPELALPTFSSPQPADIDVANAAALLAASARVAEAEAMTQMARASARPMTAVGVRLERERGRMGNEDTFGLAFMSEIPFRSRRYAAADARAAAAEREAARAEGDSARHRIAAALSRVGRADRLADAARRLAADTRSRLQTEFDSFIRTAGTTAGMGGESSMLQAVEILEKTSDTELQVIAAETAAKTARAELWRYAPATTFFSKN